MRSDVLVKMELLDQKHVQDTVHQLQRLITTMQAFHDECAEVLKGAEDLFPIEVDLSTTMLGKEDAAQMGKTGLTKRNDPQKKTIHAFFTAGGPIIES